MTKEQLAGKLVPKQICNGRKEFLKGLEIASEYGNWLGGYAITKQEADKLLEQFLTEKYGSNEQQ